MLLANDRITCGSAAFLSPPSVSIKLDLLERHVFSQKLAPNIISDRQFCPGGYVSSPVRQNGGTVSVAYTDMCVQRSTSTIEIGGNSDMVSFIIKY